MERDGQYVVTVVKDAFGPIAMVHVPIKNGDFENGASGFRGLDCDCDVGQQTESHRPIRATVMARWAAERVGVGVGTIKHGRNCRGGQPCRQCGKFETTRCKGGVVADFAALTV